MSALDPKILAKIKKCLALSGSPNPNEAAIAMRQAHALMRQHGVDALHVTMSEVGESTTEIRTMSRDKPANWEACLATTVGKAFGCQVLISRTMVPKSFRAHLNEGQFIFIGQKAQAEVAAYTAAVLSRKCKTTRQKWIAENLAGLGSVRGGKAKVTSMGDAFAEGWVRSIAKLVADFANPPGIDQAIEKHIAEKNVGSEAPTRKVKDIGREEVIAAQMGAQAAKGESLYRPMRANAPKMAIAMESGPTS
jgi:hypothetical protein